MAGFQVDMGCPTRPEAECTDPGSDWYEWVTDPTLIADPALYIDGDSLLGSPGHWELYEQDFDLAAGEAHLNALRYSIEWSRVFPQSTIGIEDRDALEAVANQDALAHYRAYFTSMRAHGLHPLATLHHYTIPTWMHDALGCHADLDHCTRRGWLDRATMVHELAKYAGFVAAELGDLVDDWATENEPMAVVLPGYLYQTAERSNPPGVMLAFDEAKTAMGSMIEAHARMYDAVTTADVVDADGDGRAARVGLVFAFSPAHPRDPEEEIDLRAVQDMQYLYDYAFLDAVVKGLFDADLDGEQAYREDLDHRMDFLGINYYATVTVTGMSGPILSQFSPLTRFDPVNLEIDRLDDRGIYETMTLLAERYPDLPIMVTENNVPFDGVDDARPEHLVRTLIWLRQAIDEGVPVEGFFYWSLMDNYEWNIGTGFYTGLYAVDPADPQKTRVPRAALLDVYSRIAAGNGIPDDLTQLYPLQ